MIFITRISMVTILLHLNGGTGCLVRIDSTKNFYCNRKQKSRKNSEIINISTKLHVDLCIFIVVIVNCDYFTDIYIIIIII